MSGDFGQRVRAFRLERGWTIAQLAERAHLSENHVQTIETEEPNLGLDTILALAKALEKVPGELFGDVARLTPDTLQCARTLDALPADARALVVQLVRMLSSKYPRPDPRGATVHETPRPAKRTRATGKRK